MSDLLLAQLLLVVIGTPLIGLAIILARRPVHRLIADVEARIQRDKIFRAWEAR